MRFGVEEEFCLVDPLNYSLRNSTFDLLGEIEDKYRDLQVKSELHMCIVEVTTKICSTIDELEDEIRFLRRFILEKSKEIGVTLISAGLHPLSPPEDAILIEKERYLRLISMGSVLAENVHFGMHIHVEERSAEKRFIIINLLKYFIPEIISISVNSPFYLGKRTGYETTRLRRYDRAPSAGVPPNIMSSSGFDEYIKKMSGYGVEDERDIYWDIRPRGQYGTIEIRVMDTQASIWQTISISAFILQLFDYIERNYNGGLLIELPSELELYHNRYQAQRNGIDAIFQIRGEVITARKRIEEIASIIWQDSFSSKKATDGFNRLILGETGSNLQIGEGDVENVLKMLEKAFLL
jgi:carboxylate-amine ligase